MMIASLQDKDDENYSSSMFFVYGGSFNPGDSTDTSDIKNEDLGKIIEYKMPPKSSNKVEKEESKAEHFDQTQPMQIDTLMEELKKNREKREKEKQKKQTRSMMYEKRFKNATNADSKDEAFTNLRIANLPSFMQAALFSSEFSCYGPIVSCKIMLPKEDEHGDHTQILCRKTSGFVQFQFREDAERAKFEREGTSYHGSVIHLDWSKAPEQSQTSKVPKKFHGSIYEPSNHAKSKSGEFQSHSMSKESELDPKRVIPPGAPFALIVPPPLLQARFAIDSFAERVLMEGTVVEERAKRENRENPLFKWIFIPIQ